MSDHINWGRKFNSWPVQFVSGVKCKIKQHNLINII